MCKHFFFLKSKICGRNTKHRITCKCLLCIFGLIWLFHNPPPPPPPPPFHPLHNPAVSYWSNLCPAQAVFILMSVSDSVHQGQGSWSVLPNNAPVLYWVNFMALQSHQLLLLLSLLFATDCLSLAAYKLFHRIITSSGSIFQCHCQDLSFQ